MENNTIRMVIINPEKEVDIRIKRSRTLKEEKEPQDGNQLYIVHTDGGIAAAENQEKEDMIIDTLLDNFGVDEMLKLRLKFIKVPNDPTLVFDHVEGIIEKSDETHVMADGTLAKSIETDARYIKFPGTNDSLQLVKVNPSIFELVVKE